MRLHQNMLQASKRIREVPSKLMILFDGNLVIDAQFQKFQMWRVD